jgi:hypothetical protein
MMSTNSFPLAAFDIRPVTAEALLRRGDGT